MSRAEKIIAAATKASANYIASLPKGGDYEYDQRIREAYEMGVLRGEIGALCSELGEFQNPPASTGEFEAAYSTQAGEYLIHFEFCNDEDGPDATINSVWINGADVFGDLSGKTLNYMLEACYAAAEQARADSKADAAIDRFEARQEEWCEA